MNENILGAIKGLLLTVAAAAIIFPVWYLRGEPRELTTLAAVLQAAASLALVYVTIRYAQLVDQQLEESRRSARAAVKSAEAAERSAELSERSLRLLSADARREVIEQLRRVKTDFDEFDSQIQYELHKFEHNEATPLTSPFFPPEKLDSLGKIADRIGGGLGDRIRLTLNRCRRLNQHMESFWEVDPSSKPGELSLVESLERSLGTVKKGKEAVRNSLDELRQQEPYAEVFRKSEDQRQVEAIMSSDPEG